MNWLLFPQYIESSFMSSQMAQSETCALADVCGRKRIKFKCFQIETIMRWEKVVTPERGACYIRIFSL